MLILLFDHKLKFANDHASASVRAANNFAPLLDDSGIDDKLKTLKKPLTSKAFPKNEAQRRRVYAKIAAKNTLIKLRKTKREDKAGTINERTQS